MKEMQYVMVEKKPIVRLKLKREAIEEIGFRLKDI